MPIVMTKFYQINGNYTPDQLAILQGYIDHFRLRIQDYNPETNILIGKMLRYCDDEVVMYLNTALMDLNSGYPRTEFTMFNFQWLLNPSVVIDGAIIFSLVAEGILQTRNQIDYSDSGLSIAMFNKSGLYQGWASMALQQYLMSKAQFKAAVIPTTNNSGFIGVNSEFGYRMWR